MTYHVPSKESEALQRAHGLCRGVDVAEHDVRLPAHLGRLERNYIQDDTIGRKEHVQVALQVFFGQLVVEIVNIQSAAISTCALYAPMTLRTFCLAHPLCSLPPSPVVLVFVWP